MKQKLIPKLLSHVSKAVARRCDSHRGGVGLDLALAVCLFILYAPVAFGLTYDQYADRGWFDGSALTSLNGPIPGGLVQSFTPTTSSLDFVDVLAADLNTLDGLGTTLRADIREGSINGTSLANTSVALGSGGGNDGHGARQIRFDFGVSLALTPGQEYFLQIQNLTGNNWGLMHGQNSSFYEGGALTLTNGREVDGDLYFRTGAGPLSTPPPIIIPSGFDQYADRGRFDGTFMVSLNGPIPGGLVQSFTPTTTSLNFVDVLTADFNIQDGLGTTLRADIREGSIYGTSLANTSVSLVSGLGNDGHGARRTRFEFGGLALTPGQEYFLQIQNLTDNNWGVTYDGRNSSFYEGGALSLTNGREVDGDLYFRTSPAGDNIPNGAIPEPSTVLLFGTGLAGLIAWRLKTVKQC